MLKESGWRGEVGLEGGGPVYLLSQVQASSPMPQHALATHANICMLSEPWFMPYPLRRWRLNNDDQRNDDEGFDNRALKGSCS